LSFHQFSIKNEILWSLVIEYLAYDQNSYSILGHHDVNVCPVQQTAMQAIECSALERPRGDDNGQDAFMLHQA